MSLTKADINAINEILGQRFESVANVVGEIQLRLTQLEAGTTHAPKQTSPEQRKRVPVLPTREAKKTATKKQGQKERQQGPSISRNDPYAKVLAWAHDTVIANTRDPKRMVFNEKVGATGGRIDDDPRPFLGKQAYVFRRAYKNAGIKWRDAATQLLDSLTAAGWEYPT
jgi:hypothetical protein